jgi:hypothetical protein
LIHFVFSFQSIISKMLFSQCKRIALLIFEFSPCHSFSLAGAHSSNMRRAFPS